jgi:hypothetical protein
MSFPSSLLTNYTCPNPKWGTTASIQENLKVGLIDNNYQVKAVIHFHDNH